MLGVNWTEYFHPTWAIQLEHPLQWGVSSQAADGSEFLLLAAPQDDNGCQPHIVIRRIVQTSDAILNLDCYIDDLVPSLMGSEVGFSFLERGEFTHRNGNRCVYLEYGSEPEGVCLKTRTCFVTLNSSSTFVFSCSASSPAWNRYTDLFNHIVLSSSDKSDLNLLSF
ncbi:MAG: hypothetical protein KDD66_05035 [Bdellovibrionales bacterium]|nr:hypothetical protein [Bdellovibrionales bacterium]